MKIAPKYVILLTVRLEGSGSLFPIPKQHRGVEGEDIMKRTSLVSSCKRDKKERVGKETKSNPESDAYAQRRN